MRLESLPKRVSLGSIMVLLLAASACATGPTEPLITATPSASEVPIAHVQEGSAGLNAEPTVTEVVAAIALARTGFYVSGWT